MRKGDFNSLGSKGGFTLVEIALAIAAVGILVSAFLSTRAIIRSSQVSNAVQSVISLRDAANQYLATSVQKNYTGISMTVLASQALVPSTMTGATANPWSGTYAIGPINSGVDFQVILSNVPDLDAANKVTNSLVNYASGTYDSVGKTLTLNFTV